MSIPSPEHLKYTYLSSFTGNGSSVTNFSAWSESKNNFSIGDHSPVWIRRIHITDMTDRWDDTTRCFLTRYNNWSIISGILWHCHFLRQANSLSNMELVRVIPSAITGCDHHYLHTVQIFWWRVDCMSTKLWAYICMYQGINTWNVITLWYIHTYGFVLIVVKFSILTCVACLISQIIILIFVEIVKTNVIREK